MPHSMLKKCCCAVLCLVTQSCPTLCDPVDLSLPGSSVHGVLHARILEWVAMPFARGSSQPRDRTQVKLQKLVKGKLLPLELKIL